MDVTSFASTWRGPGLQWKVTCTTTRWCKAKTAACHVYRNASISHLFHERCLQAGRFSQEPLGIYSASVGSCNHYNYKRFTCNGLTAFNCSVRYQLMVEIAAAHFAPRSSLAERARQPFSSEMHGQSSLVAWVLGWILCVQKKGQQLSIAPIPKRTIHVSQDLKVLL